MQALGKTLRLTKAEHLTLEKSQEIMKTIERWVGTEQLCRKANLKLADNASPSLVVTRVLGCFNDFRATFDGKPNA